jgi:hypothetical protein
MVICSRPMRALPSERRQLVLRRPVARPVWRRKKINLSILIDTNESFFE